MKVRVSSLKDLVDIVKFFVDGTGVTNLYDIIVVDGSECVGKTTLIDHLHNEFGWGTYRPDYNLWSKVKLPKNVRWSIFMSLVDFYNSCDLIFPSPILVDRGMLSGLVYNFDLEDKERVLKLYEEKLRDSGLKVLHIFMTPVDEDTHIRMIKSRVLEPDKEDILEIREIDSEFKAIVSMSESLDIITYEVGLNSLIDNSYCKSCGHYFAGICQNTNSKYYGKSVVTNLRCDNTYDKEVQDE